MFGLILVVLGILLLLQEVGQIRLGLSFWPVVLTLIGLGLVWSALRKWPRWFRLGLGLWVGSIGLFQILYKAGVAPVDGHWIFGRSWPLLLIAIGLSALFGGSLKVRIDGFKSARPWGRVGDVRYGGDRWALNRDFRVEHGVGDVKLDLTMADIAEGTHTVEVGARIGEVLVRVPDNVNLIAHGSVYIGELQVLDDFQSGMGGLTSLRERRVEGSDITLKLFTNLWIGKLRIESAPARTARIG
jgi:predicted membrane protein